MYVFRAYRKVGGMQVVDKTPAVTIECDCSYWQPLKAVAAATRKEALRILREKYPGDEIIAMT